MQAEQHYSLSDLYRSQNDNAITSSIKEVAEEVGNLFSGIAEISVLRSGIAKLEKDELAKVINVMFANITDEGNIGFVEFSDAVEKFMLRKESLGMERSQEESTFCKK